MKELTSEQEDFLLEQAREPDKNIAMQKMLWEDRETAKLNIITDEITDLNLKELKGGKSE